MSSFTFFEVLNSTSDTKPSTQTFLPSNLLALRLIDLTVVFSQAREIVVRRIRIDKA